MYKSEAMLVQDFMAHLSRNENKLKISEFNVEFNYNSGRVDIVGTMESGDIVSIEAKLCKWKTALDQAFRNTSFSHYSYVLLPKKVANHAKKYPHEFAKRSVGLCSLDKSDIKIEISATRSEPIQPWLTQSAIIYVRN